jgi:hypothetical protein
LQHVPVAFGGNDPAIEIEGQFWIAGQAPAQRRQPRDEPRLRPCQCGTAGDKRPTPLRPPYLQRKVRVRDDYVNAIGESGATAGIKIAFAGERLGEQRRVPWQFDMPIDHTLVTATCAIEAPLSR